MQANIAGMANPLYDGDTDNHSISGDICVICVFINITIKRRNMAFIINFVLGAAIGFAAGIFFANRRKLKKDLMQIASGSHRVSIESLEDGLYHVSILQTGLVKNQNVIDITVDRNTLFDVILSAKNKGYIDEESENLILAKYEG